MKIDIKDINKRLDEEIEFAKGCIMPQFVLGIQQAKKVINDLCNKEQTINIGDKVRNIRDNRIGIVVRVFESGSIAVLESVSPVIVNTHDSAKTLELIEANSVPMYNELLK